MHTILRSFVVLADQIHDEYLYCVMDGRTIGTLDVLEALPFETEYEAEQYVKENEIIRFSRPIRLKVVLDANIF